MTDIAALREMLERATESPPPGFDGKAHKEWLYARTEAMREVFAALPALLDEIEALRSRTAELEAALEPFAKCPTHGKHGGPFVIANAVYEDMTKGVSAPRQAYWHLSDFARAASLLPKDQETDR